MRFRGLNAAVECFLDTLYVLLLASRLRLWRGLLTTPRLAPLTLLICKPFFFLLGFSALPCRAFSIFPFHPQLMAPQRFIRQCWCWL